jgi:hypothetical protein
MSYKVTENRVPIVNSDGSNDGDVVYTLIEDKLEFKQDVKKNTTINVVIDGRTYNSNINIDTIIVEPDDLINSKYIYDYFIYTLHESENCILHKCDFKYLLKKKLTDSASISIFLIDELFNSLHEELTMYKNILDDITTNKKIPTWDCSICKEEKKYFDPRCCCTACGVLTCMTCKNKIVKNRFIICPFCKCNYAINISC